MEDYDADQMPVDIDVNEELMGNSADMVEEELTPPVADTLPVMRQSVEFTASQVKAKLAAERGQS